MRLEQCVAVFLEMLQRNKTQVKIPFTLVKSVKELNLLSFLFQL